MCQYFNPSKAIQIPNEIKHIGRPKDVFGHLANPNISPVDPYNAIVATNPIKRKYKWVVYLMV